MSHRMHSVTIEAWRKRDNERGKGLTQGFFFGFVHPKTVKCQSNSLKVNRLSIRWTDIHVTRSHVANAFSTAKWHSLGPPGFRFPIKIVLASRD